MVVSCFSSRRQQNRRSKLSLHPLLQIIIAVLYGLAHTVWMYDVPQDTLCNRKPEQMRVTQTLARFSDPFHTGSIVPLCARLLLEMHTLLSGFHPLFMGAAKNKKIKQPLGSQMGCFSTGDEPEERHQLREPQHWHGYWFFKYSR